jgi:hypothetical protein
MPPMGHEVRTRGDDWGYVSGYPVCYLARLDSEPLTFSV